MTVADAAVSVVDNLRMCFRPASLGNACTERYQLKYFSLLAIVCDSWCRKG